MSGGYVAPDVEAQQPLSDQPAQSMGSMSSQPSQQPQQSILSQSAHPIALIFLYLFRSLAIATYLLCGFFSKSYVLSTVLVVVLLSADFWTVRNVSGRVLVGLRFWNQVDEDGTSYWVFESRDPTLPSNQVDTK
jgi:Fe2+ transport system protein B